jgi:hypothetical protein
MHFPKSIYALAANALCGRMSIQTMIPVIQHRPKDQLNFTTVDVVADDFWFTS